MFCFTITHTITFTTFFTFLIHAFKESTDALDPLVWVSLIVRLNLTQDYQLVAKLWNNNLSWQQSQQQGWIQAYNIFWQFWWGRVTNNILNDCTNILMNYATRCKVLSVVCCKVLVPGHAQSLRTSWCVGALRSSFIIMHGAFLPFLPPMSFVLFTGTTPSPSVHHLTVHTRTKWTLKLAMPLFSNVQSWPERVT